MKNAKLLLILIAVPALLPDPALAGACGRNPFGELSEYKVPWPECDESSKDSLDSIGKRVERHAKASRRQCRTEARSRGLNKHQCMRKLMGNLKRDFQRLQERYPR